MSESPGLLRRMDRTGVPLLLVRLALGNLFIFMGFAKVSDPVHFLKLINQYEMTPESAPWVLNYMAVMIPWIEIVIGELLIMGIMIRGASTLALVMLTVFTPVVMIRALGLQQETGKAFCDIAFDCGCGAGRVNICHKVIENVSLIVLCLIALWSRSRRWCIWSHPGGKCQPAG